MFDSTNNIIIKLTRNCNLNCNYCYVRGKNNSNNSLMTFNTFKIMIERIIEDKKKNGKNSISIVLHGGEPLLIGEEKLSLFLKYITTRFEEEKVDYSIGMQTNLTLLNEDIVALLSKYNVHIGASFDGLKKGNIGRTGLFKESDYFKKFKLLEKYNVSYGILIVVNKYNYKNIKYSTDVLQKKLGVKGFKVNYAEDVNGVGGEIDGKTFFKYGMKPYVDEFIKLGETNESNIKLLIEKFLGDRLTYRKQEFKTNCGGKICGSGVNIIEIEPDGTLNLCGRYSENYDESYLGDIRKKDFLRIKQFQKYIDFAYKKHLHLIENKCDTCYADSICDHGCMAFHKSKYGEYGIRSEIVCDIFKTLYKYLLEKEKDIIKSYMFNRSGNIINVKNVITGIRTETKLYNFITKQGFKVELNDKEEVKTNVVIKKLKE